MKRSVSLLVSGDLAVESLVALLLLAVPDLMVRLLLGPALPDLGMLPVRIAGLALAIFVIGCWLGWQRGASHWVPIALLAYNFFATLLLIAIGFVFASVGILLWPVAIVHAGVTLWFAFVIRRQRASPA